MIIRLGLNSHFAIGDSHVGSPPEMVSQRFTEEVNQRGRIYSHVELNHTISTAQFL